VGNDVERLLEKLEAEREQRKRQAQVERCEQPAAREQQFLDGSSSMATVR